MASSITHPHTIQTPRLTLRPFSTMLNPSTTPSSTTTTIPTLQPRYLQFFHRMRRQPSVMQWSTSVQGAIDSSLAETEAWVAARTRRRWAYVVERKLDLDYSVQAETETETEPIGSMAIRLPAENEKTLAATADSAFQVDYPELGFMLEETAHGHGYATEAVGALVENFWAETETREDGEGWDIVEAYVNPTNQASLRVVVKCGFTFWKEDGDDHVYRVTRQEKGR